MVLPRSRTKDPIVYLTPLDEELAREVDNWVEWFPNQIGIVLNISRSSLYESSIRVLTPQGIGVCFSDELKLIL